jgi:hypothetical protein
MTAEICMAAVRESLLSMNPARLIESDHLVDELRDLIAGLTPAGAAGLAAELARTGRLARTAVTLIGQYLEISAAGASGYTAHGTPEEFRHGPVLRA